MKRYLILILLFLVGCTEPYAKCNKCGAIGWNGERGNLWYVSGYCESCGSRDVDTLDAREKTEAVYEREAAR